MHVHQETRKRLVAFLALLLALLLSAACTTRTVIVQGPITQNPAVTFVQQVRVVAHQDGVSLDGVPSASILRLAAWDCALVRVSFADHVGLGDSSRYAVSVMRRWNLQFPARSVTLSQAQRVGKLLLGYCPSETASW